MPDDVGSCLEAGGGIDCTSLSTDVSDADAVNFGRAPEVGDFGPPEQEGPQEELGGPSCMPDRFEEDAGFRASEARMMEEPRGGGRDGQVAQLVEASEQQVVEEEDAAVRRSSGVGGGRLSGSKSRACA